MKFALIFFMFLSIPNSKTIFNFNTKSEIKNWKIVDDVVMGGKSSGSFTLTSEGYGKFSGNVSIENNGGFSSVRYNFERLKIQDHSSLRIRLKGDGKKYQFRIKDKSSNYYSYITIFETNGKWQNIEIKLSDLYPSYRGRKLDQPNYSGDFIEEIAFLIANYKNESFEVLIDTIELI